VEDLVVCGVLCALLEANGLQSVRAEAAGVELYPAPRAPEVARCVREGRTGTWDFSWQAPPGPASSLDLSVSWAQVAPPPWSQLACAAGDLVARQLPQALPLDDAASQLGMARRSLQRALAAEGLTYSQLQAEVRCRLAGWHLLRAGMPISEVGFVCGYADQAHLTREFKRRVGVPPARYQGLFSPA
jgi:AraC-like DNA-binding protein